jgi:methyl-accepting chemotaxis protein
MKTPWKKTMTKGYKRKKFYFKDSPQGKYVFSYFILAGLVTLLFTLLFIYFSSETLSITYDNNDLSLGSTPDILLDMLLSINGILIVIFGFAIIYFVTRFTHRIAGPLFKIGRTIDTMITGDLNQEIYLRKNDEYKEIADKLNVLNETIYGKLKEIEQISISLNDYLTRESGNLSQTDGNDPLTDLNQKLQHCLTFFDLSGDLPPK